MAMMGATMEAALAADRKSVPSRDVKFLVFHVFLVVICSGVVVPARTNAGASESFMMIQDLISFSRFSRGNIRP
jgi:hypothetical protein